jgi:hypothetical protein
MQINLGRVCPIRGPAKSDHAEICTAAEQDLGAACRNVSGVTIVGITLERPFVIDGRLPGRFASS